MIFNRPSAVTHLEVWWPRYSDKYEDGEPVALLAQYKVEQSSPWIIVEFVKAKHLIGQRFCIRKSDAQGCKLDSNGKIKCYAVPLSKLESWQTGREILETVNSFGW